jgi:hypothetical protein
MFRSLFAQGEIVMLSKNLSFYFASLFTCAAVLSSAVPSSWAVSLPCRACNSTATHKVAWDSCVFEYLTGAVVNGVPQRITVSGMHGSTVTYKKCGMGGIFSWCGNGTMTIFGVCVGYVFNPNGTYSLVGNYSYYVVSGCD